MDCKKLLVTDFEYHEIYYHVETENTKGQEFYQIIEINLCI